MAAAKFASWDPHTPLEWGSKPAPADDAPSRAPVRRPRGTHRVTAVTDLLEAVDTHVAHNARTASLDQAALVPARARSLAELQPGRGSLAAYAEVSAPRLLPPLSASASAPAHASTMPPIGPASPRRRSPRSPAVIASKHVRQTARELGLTLVPPGAGAAAARARGPEAWLDSVLLRARAVAATPVAEPAAVGNGARGGRHLDSDDDDYDDDDYADDGGGGSGGGLLDLGRSRSALSSLSDLPLAPPLSGLEHAGLARAQLGALGVNESASAGLYRSM
jgi:hypothetical protein